MTGPSPRPAARGPLFLSVTAFGAGLALVDLAAVAVAAPSIGRSLGAGTAELQWLLVAPLVAVAALVLPGAAFAEAGRRRATFVTAALCFALASFLAARAPTPLLLIAARAAQGAAVALLVAAALAVARPASVEADRLKMERWWAGAVGAQGVAGAGLGAWLVTSYSWPAVFLVSGGWALVVAVLGFVAFPSAPEERDRVGVDGLGAVALLGALAGLAFLLVEGPGRHWTDPKVVAAGVLALVAGIGFVDLERNQARPLMPLRLFGSRTITASASATLLVHLVLGGVVFLVVLNLDRSSGFSAVTGGWASASMLTAFVVAYIGSVGIGEQPGARSWAIAGIGASVVGVLLLSAVGPASEYSRDILPGAILAGLGCGLALAFEAGAVHASFGNRLAEIAARMAVSAAALGAVLGVTLLPLIGGLVEMESLAGRDFSLAYRDSMRAAAAVLAVAAFLVWLSEPSRLSGRSGPRSET